MALCGVAEVGAEGVAGRQLRIAVLGLGIIAEALLNAHPGIVKDDPPRRTAEELQAGLNGFQKGLLVLPQEGHDEHGTGGAFAHTEVSDVQPVAPDVGLGAAPVALHGLDGVEGQ